MVCYQKLIESEILTTQNTTYENMEPNHCGFIHKQNECRLLRAKNPIISVLTQAAQAQDHECMIALMGIGYDLEPRKRLDLGPNILFSAESAGSTLQVALHCCPGGLVHDGPTTGHESKRMYRPMSKLCTSLRA